MKLMPRFSASLVLAALLCFTPSVFGATTLTGNVGAASAVLSQTSASLLVLVLSPSRTTDHHTNGCTAQGPTNCKQVPEGGTTFLYLSLAGLCCIAAAIFRIRRQTRLRQTN
jgi:hypothetical protein